MSHNRYSQHDDRMYRSYDNGDWEENSDKRKRDYSSYRGNYRSDSYHHGSSRDSYDRYHEDDRKKRKYWNEDLEGSRGDDYSRNDYEQNYDHNDRYSASHHGGNNYQSRGQHNDDQETRARTVHITMLPRNATEQDVKDLLAQNNLTNYSEVNFVNQSKGFAYVIFNDITSVTPALALSGCYVKGFPIIVKQPEEKKRSSRDDRHDRYDRSPQNQCKVYAGNVPTIFNRSDLIKLFGSFGYIVTVDMKKDENGEFNGNALFTYQSYDNAKKAVLKLNGYSFSPKCGSMKVGLFNDPADNKRTQDTNQDDYEEKAPVSQQQQKQSLAFTERVNSIFSLDVKGELSQNISFTNLFIPSQ